MIFLQVHTLEMTHMISLNEAKNICIEFREPYSADVHINSPPIAGIKNIHIKRNIIRNGGVWINNIHTLTLEVNVGRLLKLSNVSMIDLSKINVQAIFNKLDFILSKKLHLTNQNTNSADWIISRLDCGLDVKMGTDDINALKEHIRLLHKTFNPANSRGCNYSTYKGYDESHVIYESITINNKSYTYNIYYKLLQLEKEYGNNLLPKDIDEIKDVIRVEKQLKGRALAYTLGTPRKMSLLLDGDKVSSILNTIISDMMLFFGGGVHFTYNETIRIIENSKYSRDMKSKLKLLYDLTHTYGYAKTLSDMENFSKSHGVDDKTINTMKHSIGKIRMQMEALGIATAGSSDEVAQQIGKSSLININDAIQNMIKTKAVRRSKGSFCRFFYDAPNKRYKCNPSLYGTNGKRRVSIAGKTQEEAEMNVLYKIREFLNTNLRMHNSDDVARRNCIIMCRQDVENFKTVIERPEMLAILDDVLKQLNAQIKKNDAKTKVNVEEEYDGRE